MTEIEVRLLGAFQLLIDGQPVSMPSGRQRVLLVSLTLGAGHPVGADTLAHHLWGNQLPERVRGSLQTYVMRARRQLGAEHIGTEPDGYRLAVAPDRVDALAFLRLVDSSAGEPSDPGRRLDAALDLWRGEPLTSIPSTALRDEYDPQLTERYMRAVERRVDLDLAGGAAPTYRLALLRELLAAHPPRETLWERLIADPRQSEVEPLLAALGPPPPSHDDASSGDASPDAGSSGPVDPADGTGAVAQASPHDEPTDEFGGCATPPSDSGAPRASASSANR